MPRRIEAQPFFRPKYEELRYLPECPRVIDGSLYWISIQYAADRPRGGLNILDLQTGENVHHPLPGRPGFFVESGDPNTLIIGVERQIVLYDLPRGSVAETLAHLPEDDRVIINDGVCIPGGLIFGTKALDGKSPVAALYHYDYETHEIVELRGHQTCSNGKYFHDDLLIDIDTAPKTITEYGYDGDVHPLRLIVPPDRLPSFPDGMRPSRGGESVVVAYYNPGEVADGLAQEIRLEDGEVLTEWIVRGSPRVSCPEIAEVDGESYVFFTTAVEGMPENTQKIAPQAGTIFRARLND